MADINYFEFKGRTYQQDPSKAEQQMKEARYKGCVFCSKCPKEVGYACCDWCAGDEEKGEGTIYGDDYKELKASKKKTCAKNGRPEEVVYQLYNEEMGWVLDCPTYKTYDEALHAAVGKCKLHNPISVMVSELKPCTPIEQYCNDICKGCPRWSGKTLKQD